MPILLFGLFEQKVSIDKIEKNPYLYRFELFESNLNANLSNLIYNLRTIKNNRALRTRQFVKWNLFALYHSAIAFFFGYAMFSTGAPFASDGKVTNCL